MFKLAKKVLSLVLAIVILSSINTSSIVAVMANTSSASGQITRLYEATDKSVGIVNDLYTFVVETNASVTRLDFWYHLKTTNEWINAGTNGEGVYMTSSAGKTKWRTDPWRLANPGIDKIGVTANGSNATPTITYSVSITAQPTNEGTLSGHKYAVYDVSMTWHEAKAYCESLNGHLATITMQDEQSLIENLIKNKNKDFYWLGATDEVIQNEWKWVTGESWKFEKWGNKDNNGGIEDYLAVARVNMNVASANYWNDLPNNAEGTSGHWKIQNSGFICEWDTADISPPVTTPTINHLGEQDVVSSEGAIFYDKWEADQYTGNFTDANDKVFKGIGMYSPVGWFNTSGSAYVSFNIPQGAQSFSTYITVEKYWCGTNEYGSSLFTIYADDTILFKKTLTSTIPAEFIKVNIPKGSNKLRLEVQQNWGAGKGNHACIWGDPTFEYGTATNDPQQNTNLIYEIEPNNTMKAANSMGVNKGISGKMDSDMDVDWFKFSLPKRGAAVISLSANYTISQTQNIFVYKSNGELIDSFASSSSSLDGDSETLFLEAEEYFIKVESSAVTNSLVGVQYTLTVITLPVKYVKETIIFIPALINDNATITTDIPHLAKGDMVVAIGKAQKMSENECSFISYKQSNGQIAEGWVPTQFLSDIPITKDTSYPSLGVNGSNGKIHFAVELVLRQSLGEDLVEKLEIYPDVDLNVDNIKDFVINMASEPLGDLNTLVDLLTKLKKEGVLQIKAKCPIDISITLNNETLSRNNMLTSWGMLVITGTYPHEQFNAILIPTVLANIKVVGTGNGTMDYSVKHFDASGNTTKRYDSYAVPITSKTIITTTINATTTPVLNIDTNGDGKVDKTINVENVVKSAPTPQPISTIPNPAMKSLEVVGGRPSLITTETKLQFKATANSGVTKVLFSDNYFDGSSRDLETVTSSNGVFQTSKSYTFNEGKHIIYCFPIDASGNVVWNNGVGVDDAGRSYGAALNVVKPISKSTDSTIATERGNTVGNIVNGGIVAQQGDWIYYSNNAGLYKIRTDGSNKTKLNDDRSYSINVMGDWVYYMNYSDNNGNLYKIRTDGTSRTKLNDDSGSNNINVVGNWVYYVNGSDSHKIYKIRTDGTDRTKLHDDESYFFNVVGDWVYYMNYSDNDGNLYKIRTDGTSRTKLNDDRSYRINVVGDWVYYQNYSNDSKFYKIRTDGTDRTKISEDSSWINVVGDWVYYRNESDGDKLYIMRTDGTRKTKLNNDKSYGINVVGDWIYYDNGSDGSKLYKIRIDGTERQRVD